MGLLDKALAGVAPQAPAAGGGASEAGIDTVKVQNDPAFQRLAPASQRRILSSLGVQPAEQPNQVGTSQVEFDGPAQTPPARNDMPIESAVPGELKKALIDPAYRLMTGRSQGVGGTVSDAIGTATLAGAGAAAIMSGPFAAGSILLAPTVGGTVKGLLTDFNASRGWTEFIGSLAEIGTGGVQALSGWRGMMRGARNLMGEATAGGVVAREGMAGAQTTAKSTFGAAVITRANAAFEARARPISRAIDGLEASAARLTAGPNDPAFTDVAYLVDQARAMRVRTPEITRLEQQIANGNVNIGDVVELRKALEGNLNHARSAADPNIPASRRLARQIRGYATDAITEALGPAAGGRYGEALIAWRTQVRDPQRVLRAITSKNLEPSTAFELTYGTKTSPEILNTLAHLRDTDPTFRATLRLGAMQHFYAAAGGNLRQSVKGSEVMRQLGPMLGNAGLFTPEELTSLQMFMRPGVIDQAMGMLGHSVSGRTARVAHLGIAAAGYGASGSAVYHLMSTHPHLGFLAIAASGGLPLLRRVMLAPPGSPAALGAANGIVRGLTDMGSMLTNRESVELDD